MKNKYKKAILGGTFDHLHAGHIKLLDASFANADHVTICVSLPILYKNKVFASSIEGYSTRKKAVESYLKKRDLISRSTTIPLKDIYGPSLKDKSLEAIVVTGDTKPNAELINISRHKNGLPPLEIITTALLAGGDGKIITSERIRAGEIDRNGASYLKFFMQKQQYILPENLRQTLQKPVGIILKNTQGIKKLINGQNIIIAVGDISAMSLKEEGIDPPVSIIDFKSRRQNIDRQIFEKYFPQPLPISLVNPPGTINKEIAKSFESALNKYLSTKKPQIINVDGEEDLLALPAILMSPLDTLVVYGQYDVGIVAVEVSEKMKEYAKKLLDKFYAPL